MVPNLCTNEKARTVAGLGSGGGSVSRPPRSAGQAEPEMALSVRLVALQVLAADVLPSGNGHVHPGAGEPDATAW